ncbi:MAG: FMN-binding protein [Thermoguttaceae bacterium]|nr:FMN-binding protein [Thermoguttaceae bacterium]
MSESTVSNPETRTRRPSYLLQAWLVIFLSALYAVILVSLQINLSGKIEANKKKKTFEQIPLLVEGADPAKTRELSIMGTDGKLATVLQIFDADEQHIGWIFPGKGQGFGDVITLLVGLDRNAETLTGLCVLEQKETPGLGNFIEDEPFRSQFTGKSTSVPLAVVTGEPVRAQDIRAVTGATISSKAVCDIVNQSVQLYRAPALEAGK